MALSLNEIPLNSGPERFGLAINGVNYRFRTGYANADGSGWYLDISHDDGSPLISGMALVPGTNLMAPYSYMGLNFALLMTSESGDPPLFGELGTACRLYVGTLS